MKSTAAICALILLAVAAAIVKAAEVHSSPALPNVPPGFSIELAAGPPLVKRPIAASFDEEGRLYVTESSGSNDPVAKQHELRPHRIVRLEDLDGDGKFDRRTIFADRMMLPQGALFWRGSLYVSAAPSIWKLTDTDGDGVADERIEWFQGKTLTGCANDLHGPYLGPDGWLYWCKGAFAEQTHIVHGREWKSRAAHIFRSRPDGTGLEPVITGGMDNPVGVVFTSEGEPILSATYLATSPRLDGLVHAVYGGVYGKQHGVLEGHPRTGDLMPALVAMSPAAPCGVARYDSDVFGPEFRDNLFVCQFNLRKVSRHVLRPAGSSFVSTDSDFVASEDVDFHPTDVVMDADGSLLVIDTGGWYKLCCPTSTLWKPDVLGGVYRVRRIGAATPVDPRGRRYVWPELTVEQLWELLADARPAVRQRALDQFVQRRDTSELKTLLSAWANRLTPDTCHPTPDVSPLSVDARHPHNERAAAPRVWALVQVETAESRSCVRQLLGDPDEFVRHVALTAVSLHRDADALPRLIELLATDMAANRRVAAEALGRIGKRAAVSPLLSAAANADDRILQHSITYALIEIADPAATRAGLVSDSPGKLCSALIALDQMSGGGIDARQVIPLLSSQEERVSKTARWLVALHPEWGSELAEWFRGQFAALFQQSEPPATLATGLEEMLFPFVSDPSIQQLLAEVVLDAHSSDDARELALRVMARAKLRQPPAVWRRALASALAEPKLLQQAIATARELPTKAAPDDELNNALVAIADAENVAAEARVAAMAVVSQSLPTISESQFELLMDGLSADDPPTMRSTAADGLSKAQLTRPQLQRLCSALKFAGPLEVNRLLAPFARSSDEQLGLELVDSLNESSALASLRIDLLREVLKGYSLPVQKAVDELELQVNVDAAAQRKRIEELSPLVANGDVRRGHAVFYNAKAACSSCHRLGNAGGTVGPDLTRIGESRTEQDLLESILYPSLSFVRSYEPVVIITVEGRVISGTVRDENDQQYVIATGPDHEIRVMRDEVEQIEPGTVSTMPTGLDQQLTLDELADLIAFLKNKNSKAPAR
ncbi:MAG: PVC-type heme-binding CxxCH protein [Pirellulales bacterium]